MPSFLSSPPRQVRHLLDSILVADSTKRATVADIEADPWFVGPDGLGIAGADVPIRVALGLSAHDALPAPTAVPGTPTLAHQPSAKDIEEAVEELEEEAHGVRGVVRGWGGGWMVVVGMGRVTQRDFVVSSPRRVSICFTRARLSHYTLRHPSHRSRAPPALPPPRQRQQLPRCPA